jgi:DNA-binding transcriptional regulator YhcF (GntR family)
VNILLQLANRWWQPDNLPHPSKAEIAKRIRVSAKTVQRKIARLEKDGFIKRKKRFNSTTRAQQPNFYDFSGLIAAAAPYAKEELERREARRLEEALRGGRKRARVTAEEET